jgi:cardiolipin synthase A/B
VRLLAVALLLLCACKKKESRFEIRYTVPKGAFSAALEQTTGSPLRPGHRIEVLDNGKVFDALVADLGKARETIHAEMYIWRKGEASERVLSAIGARRVKCRILLDAVGSMDIDDAQRQRFASAGCDLRMFRPLHGPNDEARDHRKIFVIDGRVGFTGGFGVDDKWLGDGLGPGEGNWRDTNVRVEGTAVSDMQESFAEHWQEAGGDLLPPSAFPEQAQGGSARAAFVRSDASPVVTRAERLTQLAIAAAHKRVWIENAYFVPSRPILDLLARRSAEGIDVRVVTAGRKSDSKLAFLFAQRDYRPLVERGVRVWEYQPAMMHAKTMLIDDELVVIGSVNLDPLSLNELEEGALVAQDRAAADRLARDFEEDAARSKEQR